MQNDRSVNRVDIVAGSYDAGSSNENSFSTLDAVSVIMENFSHAEDQGSEGIAALHAELKNFLENGHSKSEADATELGKFLKATATFFSQDISSLRVALEQTEAERDKLYSDLLDANSRAQILAQEIDDRHANLEKESQNLIRNLEAKHAEQLRFLQEQLDSERDSSTARWQHASEEFSRQLNIARENELLLKSTIDSIQKDNDKLLKELASMNDLINSLEKSKSDLEQEFEASLVTLAGGDKSERKEIGDGRTSPSVLTLFKEENRRLRDINDELQAELESAKTKVSSRSSASELSHSSQSVKRRGSSTDYDSDTDLRQSSKMLRGGCGKAESLMDLRNGDDDAFVKPADQSIATQLLMAKRSNSFESLTKLKGKIVKVLEKWRAQFVDEILDGSGASEDLRGRHESLLLDLESKLIEAATTESVLVSQLDEMKQKYEQLQEIQQVFESERIIGQYHTREQCLKLEAALKLTSEKLKDKEAECSALLMELERNKQMLEDLETTVDLAIREEMQPFKQCLEEHRSLVEGRCADINARVDEATRLVVGVLERERSVSEVRREKAGVLSKIGQLEIQLTTLLNSFPLAVPDVVTIEPVILCNHSKCNEVKCELDRVKAEILKILDEKAKLSKDKDAKSEDQNLEQKIEERVKFETALLQKRIKDLNQNLVDIKEKHDCDKKGFERQISEMQNSLELMKTEYDALDEYWQQKVDEERVLFDKERDTMDDKFDELQEKIRDLEELLSKSEEKSETSSLSTIDERATFEKQAIDLEEENIELRRQLAFYQAESSRVQYEEVISTAELQEELESLKSETQYDRFNHETELESYRSHIGQLEAQLRTYEAKEFNSETKEELAAYRTRVEELRGEIEALEGKHRSELKNAENKFRQKLEKLSEKGFGLTAGQQTFQLEQSYDSLLCRRAASPLPLSCQTNRISTIFNGPPPTMCNKLVKPLTVSGRTACKIELSVLQSLNNRLRQQDERVKQLEMALKFQQQATDKILSDSKTRHESEVVQLERILSASQELLNQQLARFQIQAERLVAADSVVQQLYSENSLLVQALESVRSSLCAPAGI